MDHALPSSPASASPFRPPPPTPGKAPAVGSPVVTREGRLALALVIVGGSGSVASLVWAASLPEEPGAVAGWPCGLALLVVPLLFVVGLCLTANRVRPVWGPADPAASTAMVLGWLGMVLHVPVALFVLLVYSMRDQPWPPMFGC